MLELQPIPVSPIPASAVVADFLLCHVGSVSIRVPPGMGAVVDSAGAQAADRLID